MAIKSTEKNKTGSTEEKELEVLVDNGDLKLINSLVEAYSFRDQASLFKFAIATLLQGNNEGGIFTIKTDAEGKKFLSQVSPSNNLVEKVSE